MLREDKFADGGRQHGSPFGRPAAKQHHPKLGSVGNAIASRVIVLWDNDRKPVGDQDAAETRAQKNDLEGAAFENKGSRENRIGASQFAMQIRSLSAGLRTSVADLPLVPNLDLEILDPPSRFQLRGQPARPLATTRPSL